MDKSQIIVLAAGGTGGHLFPAEALANVLKQQGYYIVLATDERVNRLTRNFPADEIVTFSSASPSVPSLTKKLSAAIALGKGVLEARRYMKDKKPAAVVGFGGYPSVPAVFAAITLKIPTVIHEQNAVMGRANHMLAKRVSLVASGFPELKNLPALKGRHIYTGNPVRPVVRQAAELPYPAFDENQDIHILIFGGSQGARILSDVVPDAFASLPEDIRKKLYVTHQARHEDIDRVKNNYKALYMKSEVLSFFDDLPQKMAASHLVVSRAGASTIAELAAIGRPSILIPLPGALDQDQAANAEVLFSIGAATIIPQRELSTSRLARLMTDLLNNPERLQEQAECAKHAGLLDADEKLAEAVNICIRPVQK